jgi:hypothetical protein
MRIFLSHRSRDKALVREFKGMLPSFLHAWLDEDSLIWGESFPVELKTTIQSGVDFLIIFLDKDALHSKWVRQELDWALQREKELKRIFVLPILLEDIALGNLPPGFSERLFLRLSDFSQVAVEDLAKRVTLKLFQLVLESYATLQLEIPRSKSLLTIRDELSAGQARVLAFIIDRSKEEPEIPQHELEQAMGNSHTAAELYYRIEALIGLGFLSKRRQLTDQQFAYKLTKEFQDELRES